MSTGADEALLEVALAGAVVSVVIAGPRVRASLDSTAPTVSSEAPSLFCAPAGRAGVASAGAACRLLKVWRVRRYGGPCASCVGEAIPCTGFWSGGDRRGLSVSSKSSLAGALVHARTAVFVDMVKASVAMRAAHRPHDGLFVPLALDVVVIIESGVAWDEVRG